MLGIVLASLLCLASPALADTITLTTSAIPTMTINPSNDTVTLNAGSVSMSGPGNVAFQTGDIYIGNSPIPDQVIPFSFDDVITLNGITQTLTIYGQDELTSAADIFTIFAASPVNFGSYNLYLNASSYNGAALGQDVPLTLTADITPVSEPATLALLATGLVGGTIVITRTRHSALQL